jgi:osmoprotectant transport system permease protein
MSELVMFYAENRALVLVLAGQHMNLALSAVAIAAVLGFVAAILAARSERLGQLLLAIANLGQAVPSLAVLGFMIPLLGIGFLPALFALVLRALLPIFLNTYLGLKGVSPAVIEAAIGTGLKPREVLWMIEVPLAAPIILAGLRTAAVEGVALATFGAFIGAGGLGDLILQGIALVDHTRLLAGAIPVAALAILVEVALSGAEWVARRRAGTN